MKSSIYRRAFLGLIFLFGAGVTDVSASTVPFSFLARAASFQPTDIAALQLWQKADSFTGANDSSATPWVDSSGNGNTLSGSGPLLKTNQLNGKPVVFYNSHNQQWATQVNLSNYTLFVVYKQVVNDFTGLLSSTDNGNYIIIQNDSGTRKLHTKTSDGETPYFNNVNEAGYWSVLSLTRSGVTTSMHFGGEITQGGELTNPSSTSTQGFGVTGGLNGAFRPQIYYAEFILYDSALSTSDRRRVAGYLNTKWGLTPKPLLALDGNSLTTGWDGVPSYTTQFSTINANNWELFNAAVGGQTDVLMASDAAAQVDPFVSTYRSKNVIDVWGMTNDIGNGTSEASIKSTFQAYCEDRRAAGFTVLVNTVIACAAYDSTKEATRTSLNTWLRANYTTFADGLVDVAANAHFDDPSDTSDTTYYRPDGIHLETGGAAIVASMVEAAVLAL